jgi:dihydroorotate dehydrogenase (fumarate)
MDLSTTYLGLKLRSPLVPSAAAPLSSDLSMIRALEDAGASAIVLYSLFEEQITHEAHELDHYLLRSTNSYAEALTYFPDLDTFNLGPDEYLDHIAAVKKAVDIPVIASLNGISPGGWTAYAKKMQEAGADALEINLYFIPATPELTCRNVEQMYLDVVTSVKSTVSIPLSVKIGPYFSSLFDMALRFEMAGADGMVMFNRFYQPDIDLDELEIKPSLLLSTHYEMRLPMRWIAILYGNVKMNFAASSGIHDGRSALKLLMVGADATMLCSELLRHGPVRLTEIETEMRHWMEEHEYDSVEMLKGSMSQRSCAEPAAFERANYMKTLQSYNRYQVS